MPRALSLLALFAFTLPAAAQDAPKDATQQSLRDYAAGTQARVAYGMYIKGQKAGWQVEEIKLATVNGKEVAVHTSEKYLTIAFMGEKSVIRENAVTHYSLEGDGAIIYAEERSKENGMEKLRTAVPKGKGMLLTTREAGRKSEREVPVPKETLALQRKFEQWLKAERKKGDTFENWSATWEEEDIDVKETVTFGERKTILWGGVKMDVIAVSANSQGADVEQLVQSDGTPVTGTIGGLIEIRMEPEKVAKKLDGPVVDLLNASAVFVDKDLGDAEEVTKLVLEVDGLGDYKFPQSHRQKTTRKPDGTVTLELSQDGRSGKDEPLTPEQFKSFTKATPAIQCLDATMIETAKKIVGDEKDPIKQATKLHTWVYKKLKKTSTANAESALAVLDNKAGDCTEHALLFTALARAVGLPAREVGGLAFVSGKKPLFGWHAWAEVHDGKQWVTVDPTWHEVYVDATHIKFSEARDDMAWINVAGKLKLKVVSFETKK